MADRIGQQLGHYRLIRFIGRGSFAEVYLGEHERLLTQAAVKIFHVHLGREEGERFQEEARALAGLSHPHILPILDCAVDDGVPFLAMDYAPNGTLRSQFPRGTPQTPGVILPYVRQVADALHHAHGQRLTHRYVKPENMLLGAQNEVLLSDFGIAAVFQGRLSPTAQAGGNAATYMAPEQIQGQARPASDQYALAVIIYEWLSGAPPFEGSMKEVMAKHLFTEPVRLRERVRTISPAIEAVVMGGLSKDPADRFTSVESFAAAFEEACQAVPVLMFMSPRLSGALETGEQSPTNPAPERSAAAPAEPEPASMNAPDPAEPEPAPPEPEPLSAPDLAAPAFVPPSRPMITSVLPTPPAVLPAAPVSLTPPPAPPVPSASPLPHAAPSFTPILLSAPPSSSAGRSPSQTPVLPTPLSAPAAAGGLPATEPPPALAKPGLGATWREVNWIPTPTTSGAMPALQPPEPPRQGISRRAVLIGAGGGLAVAGGLAWLGLSQLFSQRPNSPTTATTPQPTPMPTHTPTPTPVLPGAVLFTYQGHAGFVRGVSWSPDGKRIASASDDQTVQVWDAFTGARPLTYRGHTREVGALAWSPDGKYLASGGHDLTLRVWDATTGQTLQNFSFGHWVMAVAWSSNGKYLAAGSWDYTIGVWETETWQRVRKFNSPGWVNALAWSPDNFHLASGDGSNQAVIWNVNTGGRIYTYQGHSAAVLAVVWSPDGTRVASGADLPDTTVQFWDRVNGEQVWTTDTKDRTSSLSWSPDGEQLAAGGASVYLLNPDTGAQLSTYQREATTLAWSPNNKYIASGGQSAAVQVWLAR